MSRKKKLPHGRSIITRHVLVYTVGWGGGVLFFDWTPLIVILTFIVFHVRAQKNGRYLYTYKRNKNQLVACTPVVLLDYATVPPSRARTRRSNILERGGVGNADESVGYGGRVSDNDLILQDVPPRRR